MKRPRKATNIKITPALLQTRQEYSKSLGYEKPLKWVQFCETMMQNGFELHLYEARQTVSKYITVTAKCGRSFKVRFSNHKPIKNREAAGDCDFFVGKTHFGISTTDDAIKAVLAFFAAPAQQLRQTA